MPEKSSSRKKLNREKSRDLDIRIQFMEGLVRRDAEYVDALQILGDHYTSRGRYEEELKVDEKLARLEPGNALVLYNLACSYTLTDQMELAVETLGQAITNGYADFRWLAKDPDLKKLRKHPLYRTLKEKIRKLKSAAL